MMSKAVLLTVLALCLVVGTQGQQCDSKDNSVLEVTSPAVGVRMQEYIYSDKASDYDLVRTIDFRQPLRPQYHRTVADISDLDKKRKQLCFNFQTAGVLCEPTEGAETPRIFESQCYTLYRPGLYKVMSESKETWRNDGCNFDGLTRTYVVEKVGRDLVNVTRTEDREVTFCGGEPAKRFVRTEYLTYKVVAGCLLHAKAQGCDLGPPGSTPCKSCKSGEVRAWFTSGVSRCAAPSATCDLEARGFRGCSQGHEAVSVKGTKLTCAKCKPHMYNDNYPDSSGSGIRVKCKPCPDYQQAPLWGSESCDHCPAGQVPTKKRAPLACKKCPAGTFAALTATKCTKCAGGYYQDAEGASECKKCPTAWRCLVPSKILGKFSTTPYRWDESGNPACASLDGKTCWKTDPVTCGEKLKRLPKLIAENKLKSLICGPYHKKMWGDDGYGDYYGWCQITKRILLQPGKPDVGATGCTADAKTVGTLPKELQGITAEKGPASKCP